MNLQAFVAQRRDLDTGWMTLGSWLSAYPPLSERVELLAPALGAGLPANTQGPQRAAGILALLIVRAGPRIRRRRRRLGDGDLEVRRGRQRLSRAWRASLRHGGDSPDHRSGGGQRRPPAGRRPTSKRSPPCCASTTPPPAGSPSTSRRSATLWARYRGDLALPLDPFSGEDYNWVTTGELSGLLYSAGPDAETATDDDIDYSLELGEEPES